LIFRTSQERSLSGKSGGWLKKRSSRAKTGENA